MLISEKIAILRLYPEKGRPYLDMDPDVQDTSFLMDLFLRGNISFKEKKVQVINRDTNSPLLVQPIKILLSEGVWGAGPHSMGRAIQLLTSNTKRFDQDEIYKHFINKGILREETKKLPRLYFNQEDVQQKLISDIKKTTFEVEKPDVADYFVLRMLKMGHLLKRHFSKPEIKEIKGFLKIDPIKIGIEGNVTDLIHSIIKELRRRNKTHVSVSHIL
ncbi:hypothetical protein ES708_10271 [subsurface metagenome]